MERKLKMLKLSVMGCGIGLISMLVLMMDADKGDDLGRGTALLSAVLFLIMASRQWVRYTEMYVDYRIKENLKNSSQS